MFSPPGQGDLILTNKVQILYSFAVGFFGAAGCDPASSMQEYSYRDRRTGKPA